MVDFNRLSAFSARNGMANAIMEAAHTPGPLPQVGRKLFARISGYTIWNAAEPANNGLWPTVLEAIGGQEGKTSHGGGTLLESWQRLHSALRQWGISHMRGLRDFILAPWDNYTEWCERTDVEVGHEENNFGLGQDLDCGMVEWFLDLAGKSVNFPIHNSLLSHF